MKFVYIIHFTVDGGFVDGSLAMQYLGKKLNKIEFKKYQVRFTSTKEEEEKERS